MKYEFELDTKQLEKLFDEIVDTEVKALAKVYGDDTKEMARAYVPILTGDLSDSAVVETSTEDGGTTHVAKVTFGNNDVEYASWIHDATYKLGPISKWKRASGQNKLTGGKVRHKVGPKYLSEPFLQLVPFYAKHLAYSIAKKMGGRRV